MARFQRNLGGGTGLRRRKFEDSGFLFALRKRLNEARDIR